MNKQQPSFYYKAWNSDLFIDISKFISKKPSWNQNLGTELLEFSLSFELPTNAENEPILLESGDTILITTNSSRYAVLADCLYGMIINSGKELLGWDYINDRPKLAFNLTCRQRDFSIDLFTIDYKTATPLSVILNHICIYHTGENLGGVMADGTIITKYQLGISDIDISSFEKIDSTALEAIKDLLSQNNLYFKIQYYVESNITNIAKVFSQLVIFDKSGQIPNGSSWSNGLTNEEVKRGWIVNPRIAGGMRTVGISREPNSLTGEKSFSYEEDRDLIKNYIILITKIQDELIDTPLNNTIAIKIERYEETVEGFKDTFTLPYCAKDIVFVARSVG